MDINQQQDLAQLLETYWPLVVEAFPAGLPMTSMGESAPKVAVLQSIGVLDMQLRVDDDFRRVVSAIADGRDLKLLINSDFQLVAASYADWYRAGK
jgi:hypothetical protein